uniref:Uncharacterized protein n=1 Tax=Triticum urartu TaxID=4572 RepID=A0A8R7PZV8_TRIUA
QPLPLLPPRPPPRSYPPLPARLQSPSWLPPRCSPVSTCRSGGARCLSEPRHQLRGRSGEAAKGGHGVAAWFKGMPWLLPMLSVWTGQIQRWVHDCDIILRGRKTTVAFTVLGCAARLICIVLMCYFQVATSSARMGQAEF